MIRHIRDLASATSTTDDQNRQSVASTAAHCPSQRSHHSRLSRRAPRIFEKPATARPVSPQLRKPSPASQPRHHSCLGTRKVRSGRLSAVLLAPIPFLSVLYCSPSTVQMFEVLWTDPNRESVGERKQRKIVEQTKRKKEENRLLHPSNRPTTSSSADKSLPGVFGNYESRKQDAESHETVRPAALASKNATSDSAGHRGSFLGSQLSPISSSGSHSQRPVRFVEDGPSYAQTLDESSVTSPGLASRGRCLRSWV